MRSALRYRLLDTDATLTLGGISPTEKVIAFCRVLLAIATFAIMVVDPKAPLWPGVAFPIVGTYVAVSLLLFWLVRREIVRGRKVGPYSVVFDVVFGILITLFTERGATPFFLLNLFVIASVSVRWSFKASAPSRSCSRSCTRCWSSSRAAGSSPTSSACSARISSVLSISSRSDI